jgi:hypothetical protein
MDSHIAGVLGIALLLCGGCAENAAMRRAMAKPYQPANVHRSSPTLPAQLRRVAMLPVTAAPDHAAQAGVRSLEPVLAAEFRKRGAFELIVVSGADLRAWSGREAWRRTEALPATLFARIREATACDAVLFSDLSTFRPYPPLAVGWHLSLVDVETQADYWAIDEVFDAGSPEVIVAAQQYYQAELAQPSVQLDSAAILNSPRRFGQYSAAAAVATLPGRSVPAKADLHSADK